VKRASRTRSRVLRTGTSVAIAVVMVMIAALAAAADGTADQRLSDMGGLGTAGIHVADNPAVAFNSTDNQYLVVWEGTENDSATEQTRIYGQLINAATGAEIGTNDFLIATAPGTDPANDAFAPAVAYNSTDNEYLVIFVGQPNEVGTESEVYGQRVNADGTLDGAVFQISECGVDTDTSADVGATFGYPLDLAYNATDNQYLVVWRCDDVGDNGIVDGEFEIIGQIVDADGSVVPADEFQISQVGGANGVDPQYDAESPSVAWNSTDNEYLVTWGADNADLGDGNREIFGRRVNNAGAPTGSEFQISTTSHVGGKDSAVSDVTHNPTDNEYLVVWSGDSDTDNKIDIFGQLIDGATGVFSGVRIAIGQNGTAADPANEPEVVYNGVEGEYLVVWQAAQPAGESEIFGQRISAAGIEQGSDDLRISEMGPDGEPYDANESTGLAYAGPFNSYYTVWGGQDDLGDQVPGENEIFGQAVVINRAPVSEPNGPYQAQASTTITLDGTGSYDPDTGDSITYAWDLDNDGEFDDSNLAEPDFTVDASIGHVYDICLKVTDSHGEYDTACTTVTVMPPPVPAMNGWGIAAVVMAVAALGVLALRRRRAPASGVPDR
jgi:hypothetical protein